MITIDNMKTLLKAATIPCVGDVCQMKGEAHPFETCVVLDVDENSVRLGRPHAKVSKIGCTKGTLFMSFEDYTIPMDSFLRNYELFTTGASGKTDNRGEVY